MQKFWKEVKSCSTEKPVVAEVMDDDDDYQGFHKLFAKNFSSVSSSSTGVLNLGSASFDSSDCILFSAEQVLESKSFLKSGARFDCIRSNRLNFLFCENLASITRIDLGISMTLPFVDKLSYFQYFLSY